MEASLEPVPTVTVMAKHSDCDSDAQQVFDSGNLKEAKRSKIALKLIEKYRLCKLDPPMTLLDLAKSECSKRCWERAMFTARAQLLDMQDNLFV